MNPAQPTAPGRPAGKKRGILFWVLAAIAAATVVSGAVQIMAPGFELRLFHGESTATSRHFFGIIGMFMLLFGGLLLHALFSPADHPVAVLWASLQKFGAFIAVTLAVCQGLLALPALAVAIFDLGSGVLAWCYWRRIRGPS